MNPRNWAAVKRSARPIGDRTASPDCPTFCLFGGTEDKYAPVTSVEIRVRLVEALKLDLVGPGRQLGEPAEVLFQAPSRWYLTGFLSPLDAKPEQRSEADADEDLDAAGETGR
jgi:hypothetical protein